MKDMLKYLIDLQAIDTQLFEIQGRKGSLPEQVEKLETQAATVKSEVENTKARLADNKKELVGIKGGLVDAIAKVKKYQDQLYLVTTNREYDALTNEIETVKSSISVMEDRHIELESAIEALESTVASSEEKSTAYAQQLEANRDELRTKSDLTDAKQTELEAARDILVKHIGQRYLRKYERILNARRRAVVAIERSSCGGCHKQLSPQNIYEIQQMDKIIECENCGRILVYLPE